ncbi:MAG: hypothetical protein EPO08_09890 [Rhodospirillaceae bacterium]|nr:MAG: hypothetical protein EPO08_09890 [Rhodospirillaceae bacterium]
MDHFKLEWLLTEKRLWMTRLPDLTDKLEGSVPVGETAWWDLKIRDATSATEQSVYTHNRDFMARFVQTWREHWFVNCWTIRNDENERMWKEYTASPRSIAIRSSYARLRASLPSFVNLGLVNYIDYGSQRIEGMNLYERVMHKHRPDFEWEQELRAMADVAGPEDAPWVKEARENHFEQIANPSLRFLAPPLDLAGLIDQVVVHPLSDPKYLEEIKALCGAGVAVTRSVL